MVNLRRTRIERQMRALELEMEHIRQKIIAPLKLTQGEVAHYKSRYPKILKELDKLAEKLEACD